MFIDFGRMELIKVIPVAIGIISCVKKNENFYMNVS